MSIQSIHVYFEHNNAQLELKYKLSPLLGFKLGEPAPEADSLPIGRHASIHKNTFIYFICLLNLKNYLFKWSGLVWKSV